MFTLLAQNSQSASANSGAQTAWDEVNRFFQTNVQIFSRGDTLASPEQLIPELQNLGRIWAVIFVIVGLVCMLTGYKFHKVLAVSLIVMIGSLLGYGMGLSIKGPPFVIAGCVGVLMAVLAYPLMKYAIAILGGLSGAFIGANLWAGIARALGSAAEARQAQQGAKANDLFLVKVAHAIPADAYWIGALIGLMACGIAAFMLSKIMIHMFTSVSGSTFAVFGVIALLLSIDPFSATVASELKRSAIVIPMLVIIPAAIGFMLQGKNSGGFKNGGGGGGGKKLAHA